MSEFLTSYPRKIGILKGLQDSIKLEDIQLDHLSLMVRIKKDEIINTLIEEGFKKVKFENKKPGQIGHGFAKKLKKPWEMHIRLLEINQGLIALQGEVEISRKYIQHIRSVRCPVVYEIESILQKHKIEYKIWNSKVRDYITHVIDNHNITLNSPKLPAMPWLLMIFSGCVIATMHLLKFLTIF
ncbi:MAG: hypothetical protein MRJ93_04110 [Nitrososphaeraceae archaeon]|nr:hypothetical protein [Nitrososphaeraceae archaeon]